MSTNQRFLGRDYKGFKEIQDTLESQCINLNNRMDFTFTHNS